MACRVFLGVFEAGFGPGIPLYMCMTARSFHSNAFTCADACSIFIAAYFYTKSEMGLRMAYWFGFAAVSGAFGGLIAFGIQHAHVEIANWRLLFIVEVS